MWLKLTLVLLVACMVPALAWSDEATDKDLKALQGKWKVVAQEVEGKKTPDDVIKQGGAYVFKGTKVEISGPSEDAETTDFSIDASKTPKQFDLVIPSGPQKGEKMIGIYDIKEGRLRICLRKAGATGKGRPKEFKTEPDSESGLVTLERVKE
jgi:uncharacterized protein (TIGR03067 family)